MEKLTKCKACGGDVAKSAKVCPHCGAKRKKSGCLLGCLVVVLLVAVLSAVVPKGGSTARSTAERGGNATITLAVNYLKEIDGVCRVKVSGNDVYISFRNDELPEDYKLIVSAASVHGSRALVNAGQAVTRCSVWLIPAGDEIGAGRSLYNATSRGGKLEK